VAVYFFPKERFLMYKLTGSKMKVADPLFGAYKNNIPVFQSVLDGNHEGAVYADHENAPSWAVLTTADCHTFVAGRPMKSETLEDILFNRVLAAKEEKQLIVFTPSDEWHSLLEVVFLPRDGFIVPRKMFLFNHEEYGKAKNRQTKMPGNANMVVSKERFNKSCLKDSWVARLMLDNVCVSTAVSATGGGYAEMGIKTNPDYQGKGYATLTAMALIEKLLHESLTPCWSTWPEKEASQKVALKIGFIPQPDINAWVWEG
jgi:hypothetical protein